VQKKNPPLGRVIKLDFRVYSSAIASAAKVDASIAAIISVVSYI
jgi:hypothetical protein